MIKKAINKKAKVNLQLLSETKEIDFKYLRGYWLLVKKDKNNANQEYQDEISNKDKNKAIIYNSSFANSQPKIQTSKKYYRSQQGGNLATRVNITKVIKKNNTKNLSHIKYYTYKQKDYYVKKCPKKLKNRW